MSTSDLTIARLSAILKLLGDPSQSDDPRNDNSSTGFDNGMIGKYVIVRCSAAGVHSGVLESSDGAQCVLTDSRWLRRWVPADEKKFLSGLAEHGIAKKDHRGTSVVSEPVARVHFTENCQILQCSAKSEKSLREIPSDDE